MSAVVTALLGVAVLVAPPSPTARLCRVLPRPQPRTRAVRLTAVPRPLLAGAVAALVTVAVGLPLVAVPVGVLVWWATRPWRTRNHDGRPDPLRMAATGDLLAACLHAGLPVPTAVRAVAGTAPADAATALRETADLLALGAEPDAAWEPARRCPATTELARAACRTARSGSALAGVAGEMAQRARAAVADEAEARAQRAGVLITGPLGLCFLPAFLCLGVIPVVIGLAGQLKVFT